ncbi:transcription initiation factor IID, 31kD subunit-domain-containing protein [Amylocarpus encephaloides]|uniref:Transcription initiation factor IID, 31kD subunit-domain-containing protein n=1 Tax=Amylocarpus encephaloides TaxID=45428 RepID=A0A9P7Y8N0_9HELO|nr:transcription initiation factor IID, 31kD subunit-domain-containing protein [Amylocarpus encephaloides]
MAEVNGDAAPQTNGHTSPPSQPTATIAASSQTAPAAAPVHNATVPMVSVHDSGLSKRPRDARLIHMLLSSLGVTAYQERVPLQLLDFAYRHSSSILSDALHLSSDAYQSQQTRAKDAPPGGGARDADGQVSSSAVQFAIASRLQYQFGGGNGGGGLSKEFLLETAQKRNAVGLPRVLLNEWGVRLPGERFVQTGVPWGLKGEWALEDDEPEDTAMGGVETAEEEGMEGGEEGGRMEDLFGGGEDADMNREE